MAQGEYVAPEKLEEIYAKSMFVSQVGSLSELAAFLLDIFIQISTAGTFNLGHNYTVKEGSRIKIK